MIHILPSLNIVILVYGTSTFIYERYVTPYFYEINYCKTQKVLK